MSWISETATAPPKNWAATRISNVADVQFSNVDKHTLDDEEPVRLCNYVDVYKNERITGDIPFMEASASAAEIARFQIQPGDVLVTKDSETPDDIAIPALVAESIPGVLCGYHLAMIRPRSGLVRGDFLYWLHTSKQFRGQYERESIGVTRFGLSQHSFLAAILLLPPADEQKRIASYLDASCRAIDAAVTAKKEQVGVLAGAFKATLQRVVTRGLDNKVALRKTNSPWLGKVPHHWALVMLKRLCYIQSGLTLGKDYEGDLVERPYLRVANVQDGHVLVDNLSTIEVPPEVAARTSLRVGDVLMTEGGDLDKLGRGVVWQGEVADCLHQNHVFAIRCHDWKLRPKFLAYASAAQHGRDYFEATGKKTTNLATTNSTKVGQFPIPLPSINEQDRLIEYLDGESGKVGGLRSLLEQQIDTLIAYRKSLIHECVTGQRRITDEDVNRVTTHAATLA